MRRVLVLIAVLATVVAGCAPKSEQKAGESRVSESKTGESQVAESKTAELKTDEEKTVYAIGLMLSRNLGTLNLSPAELELVKAGITDGTSNREKKADLETYGPKIQAFAKSRVEAAAAVEKKAAAEFLEKVAKEPGAKKLDSGLVYKEITPGTGDSPSATDRVQVNYHGTLADGTVFDSSVERGKPATFPLNGVIKCWSEGLQLMKVGGKSKLYCPSNLAYGDRGSHPKIKPGAALVFEVDLLEIVKPPTPAAKKAELPAPVEQKAEKKK